MSALTLAALLLLAPQRATPTLSAEFRLTNRAVAALDTRLFGHFMERPSWGNETGIEGGTIPGTNRLQPSVLTLLRGLRIPILRFPHGTDLDYTDWTEMIDNVPGREGGRPISTGHLGGKVTNNYGYDEFLRLAESLKSEVIIPVRFRSALLGLEPLEKEAEHAAAFVAYTNAPLQNSLPLGLSRWAALRARNGHLRPYKVKYFQIGNETWFFDDDLRKRFPGDPYGRYTKVLNAYIDAIRRVDPTVKILADGGNPEVARRIRRDVGNRVDFIVDHLYAPWEMKGFERDGKPYATEKLTKAEVWNAWTTFFVTDPKKNPA